MPSRTILSATDMHRKRGAIIKQCFRDKMHFVIEKDGVPLVALIPIDHYRAAFPEPSRLEGSELATSE